MASLLRRIVAGPRAPHPEANLDLCYVTDNIIATSGPSGSYPSRAYRNPLPQLRRWLDDNHGADWAIWEFRAEGTGYPDDDVYGRIHHFPWPDHHPPPFHLLPDIMATMRDWAQGKDLFPHTAASGHEVPSANEQQDGTTLDKSGTPADKEGKSRRIIVVHCKAGKGRSGSMAVSYLLSHEGWTRDEALQRFTDRRMRPGFGSGVSIPSQLRWIGYVERWTRYGKKYVEQKTQVTEVHVWGLRDGVKLAIEGYVDQGKKIKTLHVFAKSERDDQQRDVGDISGKGNGKGSGGVDASTETRDETADAPHLFDVVADAMKRTWPGKTLSRSNSRATSKSRASGSATPSSDANDTDSTPQHTETQTSNVIFRPANPIYVPTNDINLSVDRRANASYGWLMVTSVAHVWFNAFFEGHGPENMAGDEPGRGADQSGVFHIKWDHMDGLKGSSRKGTRAFDRAAVVWRVVPDSDPIAPAASELKHAASDLPEAATGEHDDSKGSSGEVIKELQRQATERSHAAEASGTAALDETKTEAQAGRMISEPSDAREVQEPRAADWRGTEPVREGHKHTTEGVSPVQRDLGLHGQDERDAEELEKAADSDEDGIEGIKHGITAAYDGAARVVESVVGTSAGQDASK